MEVQNYYVQRLSGYRWKGLGPQWPHGTAGDDPSAPNWESLFHRAVDVMMQFDVVFIVEEMKSHEVMAAGASQMGIHRWVVSLSPPSFYVEKFDVGFCYFVVSSTDVHDLGHENVPRYTRGPVPTLNLSIAEETTLREWNSWDTKLFEAAKAKAHADASATKTKTHAAQLGALSESNAAAAAPSLDSCARELGLKWGEPIERQRSRGISCLSKKHKMHLGSHRRHRRLGAH